MAAQPAVDETMRRRRVRRSALWLGAVAAAFYLGFIVMGLLRGLK